MLILHSTKHTLLLSATMHLFALLAFGVYLNFSADKPLIGIEKNPVIHSYISNIEISQRNASHTILESNKDSITQKKLIATINKHKQFNKYSVSSKGQPVTELLAILHSAIQKQQHYPEIAQQLERQGRVTIAFTLFTDGTISHVEIVKKSGTESLDQAALDAVNRAAPFNNIEKYLTQAQEYNIDVVFEL